MKLKVLAVSLLAMFAFVGTAQALNGPYAVRQIKKYVDENCYERSAREAGFVCIDWGVSHCYKLGQRKVRCKAYQEYRVNGHLKGCFFHETMVEPRHGKNDFLHYDAVECLEESL